MRVREIENERVSERMSEVGRGSEGGDRMVRIKTLLFDIEK